MGQHPVRYERLQNLDEPFVRRRRFDYELELTQPCKPGGNILNVHTEELFSLQDLPAFVDDANYNSLLVEVDAHVLHGKLLLWRLEGFQHLSGLPRFQGPVPASASFHSFTLLPSRRPLLSDSMNGSGD